MWTFNKKKSALNGRQEKALLGDFKCPVTLSRPKTLQSPLILSSPHSGRHYPDGFLALSKLDLLTLRLVEDAYVDEFIAPLENSGLTTLKALFPRAIIDVNRDRNELPPEIAEILAPGQTLSKRAQTGMGVIPTRIGNYDEIYAQSLSPTQAQKRLHTLYDPFHKALSALIRDTQTHFGRTFLLDCHSMPGSSSGIKRPDIVLGTRYGHSCHPASADLVEAAFEAQGFSVVRDYPYAGGYITDHYGKPDTGVEALQIEINKDLYLDRNTITKTGNFDQTHKRVVSALLRINAQYQNRPAIAAQ